MVAQLVEHNAGSVGVRGSNPLHSTIRHPDKVEGWEGSLEELAKAVGNMRYDKVSEFIEALGEDIKRQAAGDKKKNKNKLAKNLIRVYNRLRNVKEEMDKAWKICEPYMKKENKMILSQQGNNGNDRNGERFP